MSRKIIGVTVGTQLPKPNFKQADPSKGDYIKNKPVGEEGQVVGFDVDGNMIAQDAVITADEIDVVCGAKIIAGEEAKL